MQHQFIERLEKISNERKEEQARKKREYERKLAKSLKEKKDLANQMAFYGLWQNENDIDLSLAEIQTKTEKRKALVVQLRFRKIVLQQQFAESSAFNTSSTNKKALTLNDLLKNLKKLVSSSLESPLQSESKSDNVPLLVGKHILHTFEKMSYSGVVISTVPGYPSWYNIKYSGDDAIYSYELQHDYKQGNLKIIGGNKACFCLLCVAAFFLFFCCYFQTYLP